MVYERQYTIDGAGEAFEDHRSIAVARSGDVNADGTDDLIIGVPFAAPAGKRNAGTATVFSGVDGAALWQFSGSFNGARLGASVAGAGDVNQDGYDDVIVGEPRAFFATSFAGHATVYSGVDGRVLFSFEGELVQPGGIGDLFGWCVAGVGDVNRDEYPDVAVGAPVTNSTWVYSGKDGTVVWRSQEGIPPAQILAGWSVAAAGDVNRDGYADVIAGAPNQSLVSPLRKRAGAVFLYSGKDGTLLRRMDGDEDGGQLGHSVAGVGDVNRDGFPDVIAGAPSYLNSPGSVFVFSGKDGKALWDFHGTELKDEFGWSVAATGDVNADGHADMIVGAPSAESGGRLDAGYARVYSGVDKAVLWEFRGSTAGGRLGASVASAGDINGDAYPDVILGADVGTGGTSSAFVHLNVPHVFSRGNGVPGSLNIIPVIGSGGESPRIGNSGFRITLKKALGNSPGLFAGSTRDSVTSLSGMTLYGDFLTPGEFITWSFVTSGPLFAGSGTAVLFAGIPNDPGLIGLTTYWQAFVLDAGSTLPIGVSHTKGLVVPIIR